MRVAIAIAVTFMAALVLAITLGLVILATLSCWRCCKEETT